MCQGAVKRLCNRSKSCHVRKVARLLAQALKETFISRLRDELLDREVFANLKEAKVLAEDYRDHYNHHRLHGALGYLTPAQFAATEALWTQRAHSVPIEELKELQSEPRDSHNDWYREWGPVMCQGGLQVLGETLYGGRVDLPEALDQRSCLGLASLVGGRVTYRPGMGQDLIGTL
jgi:hypothetical protein